MANENSALNKQEGGNHYKEYAIQPVQYAHANHLDFFQGSVIKYITRFRDKNGKEDLLKARHFIDMLIELEYGGGDLLWSSPEMNLPKPDRNCLAEMVDGHIYIARYSGKLWSWADGAPVGINENGDIMYSSWCSIDQTYEVKRWCYVQDLYPENKKKNG